MPSEKTKEQRYVPPAVLNPVPKDNQYAVCLEQYKAYLGDLGNIGTRYATVQGFYVSVIAALVSILALAESNKVFSQFQTSTLLVVCAFAVVLCIVWAVTIRFYHGLFGAKFAVLKALEANLAFNCFDQEYKVLRRFDEESKKLRYKPFLTSIEESIPIVFSLFFVALALIRLLSHQSPAQG
jgi:predicted membrane metal-binding protein